MSIHVIPHQIWHLGWKTLMLSFVTVIADLNNLTSPLEMLLLTRRFIEIFQTKQIWVGHNRGL